MPDKGGGVRKCLILDLRRTISSVLFLLMISLLSLDHSSMCENSVARSTGEFSATSKVVSSAYLISRFSCDKALRSKTYITNSICSRPDPWTMLRLIGLCSQSDVDPWLTIQPAVCL